ncbi:MAG: hypothetical protein ACRC68_16760 [Clostridium sp.]
MEINKMSIDQLVDLVNNKLLTGTSLVTIAKDVFSMNESSIRKRLNKAGYKRVDNQFVLFDESKYEESKKIVSVKREKPLIPIERQKYDESKNVIIPNDIKENIISLAGNYDRIMAMLAKHEGEYDNKYEDEYDNVISIELPLETKKDYRATTRVNNVIWDQFSEFCNENKAYTKRDLVSMALKLYMKKHK